MCQEFESLQAHQQNMAGVAQLVRAPDCGPGGREFDSRRPPHLSLGCRQVVKAPDFDSGIRRFKSCHPSHRWLKATNNLKRVDSSRPISSVGRAQDF